MAPRPDDGCEAGAFRMIVTRWRCWRTRRRLQAWLDGEIAIDDAADLAAHVARCAACGHEVAELAQVIEAIRRQRPDLAPAELSWLEHAADQVADRGPTTEGRDPGH